LSPDGGEAKENRRDGKNDKPEAIMGDTLAGRLRALGTRGVLVQMAQRGQIIELRCEIRSAAAKERRRSVYLAAIEEEARIEGEFNAFAPTPENVVTLRERRPLRWERIAVRILGDPRRC
jgi:hypothetical protein